jgi:hypothetical protein
MTSVRSGGFPGLRGLLVCESLASGCKAEREERIKGGGGFTRGAVTVCWLRA